MNGPKEISLQDMKAGMADGSILVVDVREAIEWDAGHIPQAVFNPLSAFNAELLPQGVKIVLCCRSGSRTKTAFALAQAAGRTDVDTHFAPGFNGWVAAGEPVEI